MNRYAKTSNPAFDWGDSFDWTDSFDWADAPPPQDKENK